MKSLRYSIAAILLAFVFTAFAQESQSSGLVRRNGSRDRNKTEQGSSVSERMKGAYSTDNSNLSESDVQWMRVLYRQIDLENVKNAALYYPEEPIDGQENLFRIIMRLMANGELKGYEYLDGREIFTDKYEVKVKDVLDRFYIIYNEAKGSTEKNPKFEIDEADVPANEVLSYYIIEKWVYDTRNNRLRPTVEAICPVLHRTGDFGGDAVRYPMFWVKYEDLRPHLAQQMIFTDDDNNLPTCTYDDFFNLSMYQGDIYKTRNLQNKSMAQLYPDAEDRKHAQDSIQARLDNFESKLWTPTRQELAEAREAKEAAAAAAAAEADENGDMAEDGEKAAKKSVTSARGSSSTKKSTSARGSNSTKKSTKKAPKVKESSVKSSGSSNAPASNAAKSVRRRKK